MTKGRFFGNEPPFNAWCRMSLRDAQHGLCLSDLDLCAFRWDSGRLGLFEVKARGAQVSFAQADLLSVLDALLRLGADTGKPIRTARGERVIEYHGLHVVRMEGLDPDLSAWIELDGKRVTREELIATLNLERGCANERKRLA